MPWKLVEKAWTLKRSHFNIASASVMKRHPEFSGILSGPRLGCEPLFFSKPNGHPGTPWAYIPYKSIAEVEFLLHVIGG